MSIKPRHLINWKTAAGIVIANMIGTGVFTSLGFQLADNTNTWTIILLWSIGGMMALIGALIYAELGTHFRKSGGDYIFLSETLHPVAGYLYAWISLAVGFSAPIAIAAMAMVAYWGPIIGEKNSFWLGLGSILTISLFHSISIRQSGKVQNLLTVIKIVFVFGLIILGFTFLPSTSQNALDFSDSWKSEVNTPGFAISLVYVFFAYTGWNSAAYIVEEIKEPQKSLPKALISASILVMVVYILLQLVFLRHAGVEQLSGKVDVATLAFGNLFGEHGVFWISLLIGVQLLATISGYIWVGPRITQAMAKDFRLWKPLAKVNSKGVPVRALWFNTFISLMLMLTGSFESVLLYAGLVLQVMGTLTIAASLKVKNAQGFKSPFKPWIQYVYIAFSLWVMGFMFYGRPLESLYGFLIILAGLILYFLDKKSNAEVQNH